MITCYRIANNLKEKMINLYFFKIFFLTVALMAQSVYGTYQTELTNSLNKHVYLRRRTMILEKVLEVVFLNISVGAVVANF